MAVLWTPDFRPELDFSVHEGDPLKQNVSDYYTLNDQQDASLSLVTQQLDKGDHGIAEKLTKSQVGRLRLLTVLAREATNTSGLDRYASLLRKMTYAKLIGPLVVVSNHVASERVKSVLPDRFGSVYIEPGLFQVAINRLMKNPEKSKDNAERLAEIHLRTLTKARAGASSSVSIDFQHTKEKVDEITSGIHPDSEVLNLFAQQLGGLLIPKVH